MALKQPSGYGVLIRRNARTSPYLTERTTALLRADPNFALQEEGLLVALTLGRSGQDAASELAKLKANGCEEFADYVVTTPLDGVRGALPEWLHEELLPTGNPPELTAKMSEDVQAMWEANRQRVYSSRA